MASQNEIANWACDLLGEPAIDDISDDTQRATLLRNAWNSVRDAGLRARWWRFSIVRTSLAALEAAPAWGFSYQYQIEGDAVRVIQVDQYYPGPVLADYVDADTSPYRIEGDKILTDLAAPLKVRWIVNSKDVGLWDACFAKVMACDLADRVGFRLTESTSWEDRVEKKRKAALLEALRANALEQPPAQVADGSWVAARFDVA